VILCTFWPTISFLDTVRGVNFDFEMAMLAVVAAASVDVVLDRPKPEAVDREAAAKSRAVGIREMERNILTVVVFKINNKLLC